MEYKCIKEIALEKRDENEFLIEGEFFIVSVNSIWELQDAAYLCDVRLEGDLGWIEISVEHFEKYFKVIEGANNNE